jgi:hypothetical protein
VKKSPPPYGGGLYICSMRWIILFFLVGGWACSSGPGKTVHQQLEGNWFVIYPEEELRNEQQKKIFARIQDSLVTLKGVKPITLQKDGTFIQWDSTGTTGQWGLLDEKMVVVNNGGRGFNDFKALFTSLEKDKLSLTEYIDTEGERIKLVWHLRKISSGEFLELFDPAKNEWRQKPPSAESPQQIKERLSAMLHYYAIYFKLIAEQSSYFMPIRVMLPLKFYQHAIGMKELDIHHRFVSLFYSVDQASMAYDILKQTVNKSDHNFPESDKNSYSLEYAMMLEQLAKEIKE